MRPPVREPPFTSSRVARSGYSESMKPANSLRYPTTRMAALSPIGTLRLPRSEPPVSPSVRFSMDRSTDPPNSPMSGCAVM
jgi:hypothetical protein